MDATPKSYEERRGSSAPARCRSCATSCCRSPGRASRPSRCGRWSTCGATSSPPFILLRDPEKTPGGGPHVHLLHRGRAGRTSRSISTFSLLYSIPVVAHVPVRQPPLRLPLPRRDQELMAGIDLRRADQGVSPAGSRAVDDLDLTIADGEFFALLGPSGCGKTTLLRTIAGLEDGHLGQLLTSAAATSRALPPGERDVAMVFQDYALFPHMDVRRQHRLPAADQEGGQGGTPREGRDDRRRARPGATLLDRRPGQLSGGQQQRVALARAMAYQPAVFLLRRAAVQPGRAAAARGAHVPQAAAARPRRHHRLRHPRPGRGAGAWPTASPSWRPGSIRQVGTPRGGVPPPRQHVRRELHRLDAR